MRIITVLLISFFTIGSVYCQQNFNQKIENAFNNAQRGINWALENIPDSKASLNKDLIIDDTLIAKIKLSKEVEGIKVESTGWFNTYEVTIKIYRSHKSLNQNNLKTSN